MRNFTTITKQNDFIFSIQYPNTLDEIWIEAEFTTNVEVNDSNEAPYRKVEVDSFMIIDSYLSTEDNNVLLRLSLSLTSYFESYITSMIEAECSTIKKKENEN